MLNSYIYSAWLIERCLDTLPDSISSRLNAIHPSTSSTASLTTTTISKSNSTWLSTVAFHSASTATNIMLSREKKRMTTLLGDEGKTVRLIAKALHLFIDDIAKATGMPSSTIEYSAFRMVNNLIEKGNGQSAKEMAAAGRLHGALTAFMQALIPIYNQLRQEDLWGYSVGADAEAAEKALADLLHFALQPLLDVLFPSVNYPKIRDKVVNALIKDIYKTFCPQRISLAPEERSIVHKLARRFIPNLRQLLQRPQTGKEAHGMSSIAAETVIDLLNERGGSLGRPLGRGPLELLQEFLEKSAGEEPNALENLVYDVLEEAIERFCINLAHFKNREPSQGILQAAICTAIEVGAEQLSTLNKEQLLADFGILEAADIACKEARRQAQNSSGSSGDWMDSQTAPEYFKAKQQCDTAQNIVEKHFYNISTILLQMGGWVDDAGKAISGAFPLPIIGEIIVEKLRTKIFPYLLAHCCKDILYHPTIFRSGLQQWDTLKEFASSLSGFGVPLMQQYIGENKIFLATLFCEIVGEKGLIKIEGKEKTVIEGWIQTVAEDPSLLSAIKSTILPSIITHALEHLAITNARNTAPSDALQSAFEHISYRFMEIIKKIQCRWSEQLQIIAKDKKLTKQQKQALQNALRSERQQFHEGIRQLANMDTGKERAALEKQLFHQAFSPYVLIGSLLQLAESYAIKQQEKIDTSPVIPSDKIAQREKLEQSLISYRSSIVGAYLGCRQDTLKAIVERLGGAETPPYYFDLLSSCGYREASDLPIPFFLQEGAWHCITEQLLPRELLRLYRDIALSLQKPTNQLNRDAREVRNNKLNNRATRKLSRPGDRNRPNAIIWDRFRSPNPEALTQPNRLIYYCTPPKDLFKNTLQDISSHAIRAMRSYLELENSGEEILHKVVLFVCTHIAPGFVINAKWSQQLANKLLENDTHPLWNVINKYVTSYVKAIILETVDPDIQEACEKYVELSAILNNFEEQVQVSLKNKAFTPDTVRGSVYDLHTELTKQLKDAYDRGLEAYELKQAVKDFKEVVSHSPDVRLRENVTAALELLHRAKDRDLALTHNLLGQMSKKLSIWISGYLITNRQALQQNDQPELLLLQYQDMLKSFLQTLHLSEKRQLRVPTLAQPWVLKQLNAELPIIMQENISGLFALERHRETDLQTLENLLASCFVNEGVSKLAEYGADAAMEWMQHYLKSPEGSLGLALKAQTMLEHCSGVPTAWTPETLSYLSDAIRGLGGGMLNKDVKMFASQFIQALMARIICTATHLGNKEIERIAAAQQQEQSAINTPKNQNASQGASSVAAMFPSSWRTAIPQEPPAPQEEVLLPVACLEQLAAIITEKKQIIRTQIDAEPLRPVGDETTAEQQKEPLKRGITTIFQPIVTDLLAKLFPEGEQLPAKQWLFVKEFLSEIAAQMYLDTSYLARSKKIMVNKLHATFGRLSDTDRRERGKELTPEETCTELANWMVTQLIPKKLQDEPFLEGLVTALWAKLPEEVAALIDKDALQKQLIAICQQLSFRDSPLKQFKEELIAYIEALVMRSTVGIGSALTEVELWYSQAREEQARKENKSVNSRDKNYLLGVGSKLIGEVNKNLNVLKRTEFSEAHTWSFAEIYAALRSIDPSPLHRGIADPREPMASQQAHELKHFYNDLAEKIWEIINFQVKADNGSLPSMEELPLPHAIRDVMSEYVSKDLLPKILQEVIGKEIEPTQLNNRLHAIMELVDIAMKPGEEKESEPLQRHKTATDHLGVFLKQVDELLDNHLDKLFREELLDRIKTLKTKLAQCYLNEENEGKNIKRAIDNLEKFLQLPPQKTTIEALQEHLQELEDGNEQDFSIADNIADEGETVEDLKLYRQCDQLLSHIADIPGFKSYELRLLWELRIARHAGSGALARIFTRKLGKEHATILMKKALGLISYESEASYSDADVAHRFSRLQTSLYRTVLPSLAQGWSRKCRQATDAAVRHFFALFGKTAQRYAMQVKRWCNAILGHIFHAIVALLAIPAEPLDKILAWLIGKLYMDRRSTNTVKLVQNYIKMFAFGHIAQVVGDYHEAIRRVRTDCQKLTGLPQYNPIKHTAKSHNSAMHGSTPTLDLLRTE